MATATPRRPAVFNLANQLTLSRFALGLVLFVFIHFHSWTWCIVVFAAAAVTDWLDGYFARRQGLVSTLGRVLDPLVDKVLIGGAYIFLLVVEHAGLAPWMVTVVVAREMIITGLRSFMEHRGATFGADWLGKIKMVLQCATLFAIFLLLEALEWPDMPVTALGWVRDVLIYAMLAATALSGLQYLWRAALLLKSEEVAAGR
jgi:CDP-diacylglycerol---glycerol-3-phosphate 3-phosphatidyltransferase